MSLTNKQIDELRAYAAERKGELAKLINDAADTIEMLSAKLHASQMERSSQYYHGGWIPCQERLPEDDNDVLVQMNDGTMMVDFTAASSNGWFWSEYEDEPIAWMPLPEPYREEGENQ